MHVAGGKWLGSLNATATPVRQWQTGGLLPYKLGRFCYNGNEEKEMRYPVIVSADLEDGGFVAECPALPGCVSEGDTVEAAMANIRDAIEECLRVLKEKGQPTPEPSDTLLASVEVAG